MSFVVQLTGFRRSMVLTLSLKNVPSLKWLFHRDCWLDLKVFALWWAAPGQSALSRASTRLTRPHSVLSLHLCPSSEILNFRLHHITPRCPFRLLSNGLVRVRQERDRSVLCRSWCPQRPLLDHIIPKSFRSLDNVYFFDLSPLTTWVG